MRDEQVNAFVSDDALYNDETLGAILRTTLIYALFGALSGAIYALAQGVQASNSLGEFDERLNAIVSFVYAIGQLGSLIAALLVLNIARRALRMSRRLADARQRKRRRSISDGLVRRSRCMSGPSTEPPVRPAAGLVPTRTPLVKTSAAGCRLRGLAMLHDEAP